jgi:60 kDa SS-A/Ro ribonucleoprotein
MANKNLFNTAKSQEFLNEAEGVAYSMEDKAALAQLAATGCLSGTFYASAQDQLNKVLQLATKIASNKDGTKFLGKLAIYARQQGFMKDMPALLVSILAVNDPETYEIVFPQVIDNGKMLRNHVQMIRSGQLGVKSLPRPMRRQIRKWFATRSNNRLFKDSVGNDPSLADVIKMVHPKPVNAEQEATFAYICEKRPIKGAIFNATSANLPPLVKAYEGCKAALIQNQKDIAEIPDVPFQLLDSLGLKDEHWKIIARNARWQMTRMNLNTFNRHKVFEDKEMIKMIADRLRDPEEIKGARAFPYQLLSAYMNATSVPGEIQEALQDAMEIAVDNIPRINGNVYVFVDVSGSMGSAITGGFGRRRGSSMRCIDVAALISAAIMRTNKQAIIVPFAGELRHTRLNPRDTVMTNAKILAGMGGGATNIGAGVAWLAHEKKDVDMVIYVSDNQSWIGGRPIWGGSNNATYTMQKWDKIKKKNPHAKMVCIDIQPYANTQAPDRDDILNVGGFSDVVWDVVAQFEKHGRDGKHWVEVIDSTTSL